MTEPRDEQPPALNPTTNLPALTEHAAVQRLSATPPLGSPAATGKAPPPQAPPSKAPPWMIAAIAALAIALVVLLIAATR